ncbi:hypothetical protein [Streptomyces clavuligerus]|uniref:Lectin-like protein BA14k n=1 Tax=Streptomyces clavuligerus TaxID=1901 RepID=B5GMG9_STRCL|nr:hypothetical protein [Streptomyces clavuligerus]ANW22380.1 hypothetical protein BB341_29080 [Streptomyces clavuligerus]AXU17287.1 hypothetical protein D1794_32200 [Streptomyces clavuligerus]EDY47515.1 hypothetical protein SSCG_00543 [Streptomyces clavuligerus]EFG04476.1 Hypothetical protein SCLAV_p0989 [Streptomyces clavuligerus]MBY6307068.1 hypothetical protein [Streptomyces clavuligerus]
MTSTLIRGGVTLALAGLAAFMPSVAHAGSGASAGAGVGVQETQTFTGFAYENSPKEAKREAENMARRSALISGYLHEQCVLLYAESYRLAPGYYGGNAAIRCTR